MAADPEVQGYVQVAVNGLSGNGGISMIRTIRSGIYGALILIVSIIPVVILFVERVLF